MRFLYDEAMTKNSGIAPPDLESPVGLIRLELGDTDPTDVDPATGLGTYLWYSDAELEAMLRLYGDNPRAVAVRILRNIAVSTALKLKKWSSADLSVDGAAITESLLKAAAALEDSMANESDVEADEAFFVSPTNGGDTGLAELFGLRAYNPQGWL